MTVIVFQFLGCSPNTSFDSKVVKTLFKNQRIEIVEKTDIFEENAKLEGRWFKTLTNKNKSGFVFSSNIKKPDIIEYKNIIDKNNPLSNKICENIENYFNCAKALEEHFLRNKNQTIKRNAKLLIFRLSNGRQYILKDDDTFSHALIHYYSKIDYYLIYASLHESDFFFLLNVNTGKTYNLFGQPNFSPTGNYFVATGFDIAAQFSSNGIQIFSINNNIIEKTYEIETKWGPINSDWKNEKSIIFDRIDMAGNGFTISKAKLLFHNKNWILLD